MVNSPLVVISLITLLVLLLVLLLLLGRSVRLVGEHMQQIENQLSKYQNYTIYLQRKDRVTLRQRLDSILKSIQRIRIGRFLISQQQRELVETSFEKANDSVSFVGRFITEYVKREVERHHDFFATNVFDRDQIEAIVKKDVHNLVIAPAGSGKTRTLTARVAFLVKCGIKPSDILALAYTNNARDEMVSRLRNEYGVTSVNIQTFHSLGRKLARLSPNFKSDVATGSKQSKYLKQSVAILSKERDFAVKLLYFAIELKTNEKEANDFVDIRKYYEYMRLQKHMALNGVKVKSISERDIANFLFLNQVSFEYEAGAKWADRDNSILQSR